MGLLQPESGLLFWMLLSFIVVFVILAKYGFPVITKMVEERRVSSKSLWKRPKRQKPNWTISKPKAKPCCSKRAKIR